MKRSVSLLLRVRKSHRLSQDQPTEPIFHLLPYSFIDKWVPFLDKMCLTYQSVQSFLGVISSESLMVRHGDFIGRERCIIMILREAKGSS